MSTTSRIARVQGGDALHVRTLEWRCNACGFPVEDGEGYIEVDASAAARTGKARKAWNAENSGWGGVTASAMLTYPEATRWRVWHRACDPNPDSGPYWFDVARCRTAADLFGWAAHLAEKNWVGDTDLFDLLREVSR